MTPQNAEAFGILEAADSYQQLEFKHLKNSIKLVPTGFKSSESQVYAAFGDHQCSIYSVVRKLPNCDPEGCIFINLGTSSQISILSKTENKNSLPPGWTKRPYFDDVEVFVFASL